MDQLGGIRIGVAVDRATSAEQARFGFHTVPAARRSRHRFACAAAVLALLGVGVLVTSMSDRNGPGPVFGLFGFAVALSVMASSRYRAWAVTRQMFKDLPAEYDAVCRFDESGYDNRGAGRSLHVEWSTLTSVVEGDRFLALGLGHTQFVSVPIERLTEVERATIRRWAQAAPGGPRWEVRRSGLREHSRLRVSPPPAGAGDEKSVATVD